MKKHKAETENYTVDSEYKNAETIKEHLLSTNLSALRKQMKDKPIDAITECLYITNIKNQVIDKAVTTAKKVLWRTAGVKVRYEEVPNVSYAILSNGTLHYLYFEEEKITEHLIFDKHRMMNASYTPLSTSDQIVRSLGFNEEMKKITFDIDGKEVNILLKNNITMAPDNTFEYGKSVVDYAIMGKYFHELAEKLFLKSHIIKN